MVVSKGGEYGKTVDGGGQILIMDVIQPATNICTAPKGSFLIYCALV